MKRNPSVLCVTKAYRKIYISEHIFTSYKSFHENSYKELKLRFSNVFFKTKAMQFFFEASSGRCSVFMSNWTARPFPLPCLPLYAHISQTASALPQRLQKPIYQKTIVQPLFSAKFCNSCCKRCNLAKRKLNVAKFTHLVIALIKSLDLFRSKEHKRRSDAKIVCSYFQLNTQCSLQPPSSLPNL